MVMRGFDPRIHEAAQRLKPFVSFPTLNFIMDCRIKLGNDGAEDAAPFT